MPSKINKKMHIRNSAVHFFWSRTYSASARSPKSTLTPIIPKMKKNCTYFAFFSFFTTSLNTTPHYPILFRYPCATFAQGLWGPRKFVIFGESGGTSRLNADAVSSQCDLVAEREYYNWLADSNQSWLLSPYIFRRWAEPCWSPLSIVLFPR